MTELDFRTIAAKYGWQLPTFCKISLKEDNRENQLRNLLSYLDKIPSIFFQGLIVCDTHNWKRMSITSPIHSLLQKLDNPSNMDVFLLILYTNDGGHELLQHFPFPQYLQSFKKVKSKFDEFCKQIDDWWHQNKEKAENVDEFCKEWNGFRYKNYLQQKFFLSLRKGKHRSIKETFIKYSR